MCKTIKILAVFFFLFPELCWAQYTLEGLSLSDSTTKWFDQQIGMINSEAYVGIHTHFAPKSRDSHPFYEKRHWFSGSIAYRNEVFDEINIMYNTLEDILILRHPSVEFESPAIRINQEQIHWFVLHGHLFVNFTMPAPNRPAGFYDQIYKGSETEFLVKRTKEKRVSSGISYTAHDSYIISIKGDYHKVNSKSALLKLMESHKSDLKPYLKKYRIKKFKNTNYQVLKDLGEFCNNLMLEI